MDRTRKLSIPNGSASPAWGQWDRQGLAAIGGQAHHPFLGTDEIAEPGFQQGGGPQVLSVGPA
jgi:hypothetical protein